MARRRINRRPLLIVLGLLILMVGGIVGLWHGRWRTYDHMPFLGRGDALYNQGRYEEAAYQYSRANGLANRSGDTAAQAVALMKLSLVLPHLETEQAIGRAIGHINQAVSKDPTNIDVRKVRLDLHYEIARDSGSPNLWMSVKEYADDLIEMDPQNARAYYISGMATVALSEIRRDPDSEMLQSRREALPYFQKACQYAPESSSYCKILARTYINVAGLIIRMRSPLPADDRQAIVDNWYKADHTVRQFLSWNPDSGAGMVLLADLLNLPRVLAVYDRRNQVAEQPSQAGELSDQELLENYLESFRQDLPRPPADELLAALDRLNYSYLQAAEKLDTDQLDVQTALADYWLSPHRRDLSKVVAALQKAVPYEENFIAKLRLYLRIAETYAQDAQGRQALDVCEEALALPKDLHVVRSAALRSSIYDLHLFAARTLLTLAGQVNRADSDFVEQTDALLDKAEQHLEDGNAIIGAMAANPDTLIIRGTIAMSRQPRARQNVREAIRLYEQARDQMESLDLRKVPRMIPQYINLHKSLAMAYHMDGQAGSAEETLTKGIETARRFSAGPSTVIDPRISLYLIDLQLTNGNVAKAEQGIIALLEQLERDTESNDPERDDLIGRTLMLRVRLYQDQGNTESALEAAREVSRRFPRYAVWSISTQVQILDQASDVPEGQLENLLKRWTELAPDSPTPWALLAELYLRNDRREDATEMLKLAVSKNPKLQDSLSSLIEITQLDNYEDRLKLQIKQIEGIADPLRRYMNMYRLYRGASIFYRRQAVRFQLDGQPDLAEQAKQQFTQSESQALSALEQAYEARPDVQEVYEPLLSVYFNQADWAKAQKLVDRAKDKNWDSVGGVYFLARFHRHKAQSLIAEDQAAALQEYQKALANLDRAVLDRPTFYQAWALKSFVETNLGRHEQALSSARTAVKQNPNSVVTLEAYLAATANEWNRAVAADDPVTAKRSAEQTYDSALRILKIQPNHAMAQSARLSYLDNFEPDQAIEERTRILQNAPGNRDNLLALIRIYLRQHQTEQIKKMLVDLIDRQPDSADLIILLTQYYNRDGEHDKALQRILSAQKRWPGQFQIVTVLADTYRMSGRPAEALQCLQDFIATATDQSKWRGYNALGILQRQLGQLDKAAESFRRAIHELTNTQPENSRPICDTATLLFSADAQQEALDVVMDFAEQNDQYAIQTLVVLYRQSSRPDDAIKWAQKAVDLEPESASAQVSLAGALLDSGKPAQAQSILEQTIQQLRDNPSALATPYIMLSNAHFMQREYDSATQLLVDAINAGVNDPAVRMRLASHYRFQGRFEDASQQYYLILDRHSGSIEARMALVDSLIRQGRFSQAETVLNEGRRIQPEAYDWPRQLANLWMNRTDEPLRKRYDKALEYALEAHTKSGGAVSTAVSVMGIYNARAEYNRCQDFYRTQIPQNMKDNYSILLPLAWANAGRWRQGTAGRPAMTASQLAALENRALSVFHQVLDKSIDNDDIESYNAALRGLVALRGLEELISSSEQDHRTNPQDTRVRILLANLLNRRGAQRLNNRQSAMAKEDLNQVVDLLEPLVDDPQTSVPLRIAIYSQLASAYTYLDKSQLARDTYLRLLKFTPNNVRALNNLAYILSDALDQPQDALPYIERALRQNPKEHNLLDTYGWTLFKAGQYNRAVMELGRSVDVQPTAVNHYHLGAALNQIGDRQLALHSLRESAKLLEDDPVNEEDIGNEVRTLISQLEND